ncbi:solute carrier organic anion transporter family member 1C1-like isoform X2 [Heterodontus francisci]|uniref:solute carrier organic anion transporter family member 1C1-like isoform X2 n=1 Tax=Heterodontus francisci TaxID=7792 RepID=UPI00355C880C
MESIPHHPEPLLIENTPHHPEPLLIENTPHHPEPLLIENTPHHPEPLLIENTPHHPEPLLIENTPHHPEPLLMENTPHHPEPLLIENTPHHPEPLLIENTPHHPEPLLMENTPHHPEPLLIENTPHHPEPLLMENTPHHPEPLLMENTPHHPEPSMMEERCSCFNNIKLFLAALSFAFFAEALSGSYMKSTITQIERRFNIPSSLVGIIDGSFEIGNLMVIAFVSYFGAKFHRPKLIGAGMILMAIGTFIMALPHFIMGRYEYESAIKPLHNSTSNVSLCSINLYDQLKSEFVDTSTLIPKLGCENTAESSMWIFILLGNVLRGIGETPVAPLGISYLDDHAKQENFAFYLGCMYTVGLLGPIFGFVLGSLSAGLFVDVGFVSSDRLTITPKDTRWVGAWWLGFLLAGVLSILAAIPICLFPKTMPTEGEGKRRLNRSTKWSGEDGHGGSDQTSPRPSKFSALAKDFLPSVKSLFCNPIYFLLLLQSVLQVSSMIGMLTFKPKFIEQQYGQTASRANLLVGIANVPPVAIGVFFGGLVVKKFKLNVIGAAKLYIGTAFTAWVFLVLFFAMGCKKTPVAGLTVSYAGITQSSYEEHNLFSQCNTGCMCSRTQWEPVCAGNGMTYVSPCLAGCKSSNGTGIKMMFHNCSCISNLTAVNSSAILGQCPSADDCNKVFPYYLAVTVLESFSYSFGGIAEFEILMSWNSHSHLLWSFDRYNVSEMGNQQMRGARGLQDV